MSDGLFVPSQRPSDLLDEIDRCKSGKNRLESKLDNGNMISKWNEVFGFMCSKLNLIEN